MSYSSAAAFYRACPGKRVARVITGQPVLDDWEAARFNVLEQLRAQSCPADKITDDAKGLSWPGGFLLKPRQYRREVGALEIRSNDMLFSNPDMRDGQPITGDKRGSRIEDNRLVRDLPNGARVSFEILPD
jgi:hypothetical protein